MPVGCRSNVTTPKHKILVQCRGASMDPPRSRLNLAWLMGLAPIWGLSCGLAARQAAAEPAPKHADLYGDPIPADAIARLGSVRLRHADGVSSLAFSPDGRLLASVSHDQMIYLWDVPTGQLVRRLKGHGAS